jgi:hypothetical protein
VPRPGSSLPSGPEISESVFIDNVETFLEDLLAAVPTSMRQLRKDAETLMLQAAQIHSQVRRGVHTNPRQSESATLRLAIELLDNIPRSGQHFTGSLVHQELGRVRDLLVRLYDQVESGVHTNPGELVIFGNPPIMSARALAGLSGQVMSGVRLVGLIGVEVHDIRYRHADDGKPYKHKFEDRHTGLWAATAPRWGRILMIFNSNSVPLWQDFK